MTTPGKETAETTPGREKTEMGESSEGFADLETLLTDALRPIEPPEDLSGRLEATLSRVTAAVATELSDWATELSEGELQALRDPRNWFRPVAALAAGGAAGTALVVLELRRRRRQDGLQGVVNHVRSLLP
jgi:hypothetical protein